MRRGMIVLFSLLILAFTSNEGWADGYSSSCEIKYVTNASGSWESVSVFYSDSEIFDGVSLALDRSGKAHIAFGFPLYYATNASGSWEVTHFDIDSGLHRDFIAVGSANNVYISFYDWENDLLKYITNASGKWRNHVIDAVDTTGGLEYSMAIDSNDKLHISYYGASSLKYATNLSGNWQIYLIDYFEEAGRLNSISVDRSGYVHISYYQCDVYCSLMYATNNPDGNWRTSVLARSTMDCNTSIAVDLSGKVHIGYCNDSNLIYATNASGSWEFFSIYSSEYAVSQTSISVDSGENVHISFDDGFDKIQYATNASGNWEILTIDEDDETFSPSIKIDSLDKVHIAYTSCGYEGSSDDDDDYDDDSVDDDSHEGSDDDGCGCL